MNSKSILMPHSCQKIGWWLLLLTVLIVVAKIMGQGENPVFRITKKYVPLNR